MLILICAMQFCSALMQLSLIDLFCQVTHDMTRFRWLFRIARGVQRGGQGQQMIWHLHDMGKWHKVCGARQKLFALGLTWFNVVWGCFASAWKWNLHRSVWPNPSPVGQHLVSITSRGCQSSSDQMRNITQPERGRRKGELVSFWESVLFCVWKFFEAQRKLYDNWPKVVNLLGLCNVYLPI